MIPTVSNIKLPINSYNLTNKLIYVESDSDEEMKM